MAETLTESFCERCGSRYGFDAPSKPKPLSSLRVLSRGLKSYVLTDGSSLGDVLEHTRSDEQRRRANAQLDRFHEAFKFCMSCRQYTCGSCWNADAGRCLSCAPVAGMMPVAVAPAPVEQVVAVAPVEQVVAVAVAPAPVEQVVAVARVAPVVVEPVVPVTAVTPVETWAPELTSDVAPTVPERVQVTEPAPLSEPAIEQPAAETVLAASIESEPVSAAPEPAPEPLDDNVLARLDFGFDDTRRAKPVDRSAFGRSNLWTKRIGAADSIPASQPPGPTPSRPAADVPPAVGPAHRPASAVPAPAAPAATIGRATHDAAGRAQTVSASPAPAPPREPTPQPADTPAHAFEPTIVPAAAAAPSTRPERQPTSPLWTPPIAEVTLPADRRATPPPPSPANTSSAHAEPMWWIVAPEAAKPAPPIPTISTVRHGDARGGNANGPISQSTPGAARNITPTPPPAAPVPLSTAVWPAIVGPAFVPHPAMTSHSKVAASDAVWAASSRDVLNRPGSGAQACSSCGLALSAAARFCRRCGTAQS